MGRRRPYPRIRDNNKISFYCIRCKRDIISTTQISYTKKDLQRYIKSDKFKATKFIFVEDHYRHKHTNYEQELKNLDGRSKLEIKVSCNNMANALMNEDKIGM